MSAFQNGVVRIRGEKRTFTRKRAKTVGFFSERQLGSFAARFRLPRDDDEDAVGLELADAF